MLVRKVEHIHYDNPIPVYDIINATPYHNFIIKGNSNHKFVSHNCALM